MEIRNLKPLADPAKARPLEANRAIDSRGRARGAGQKTFDKPVKDGGKRSERARLFADDPALDDGEASDAARERRLAELRAQVRDGTLNTPERIDAAARRMLGG